MLQKQRGKKYDLGSSSSNNNNNIPTRDKALWPKEMYCRQSLNHIGCQYSGINAMACGKVIKRGLSKSQERLILKAHNRRRSEIAMGGLYHQPPAANMAKLEWDQQAAAIAQLVADQCRSGPQMGIDTSEGKQKALFSAFQHSQRPDFRTAHYAQLVWANTVGLGCGFIEYVANGGWINRELVCHYGPTGNLPGHPLYILGKSCSAC
ncbi:unnamed protein product, partial [Notodromas monacha]